MKYCIDTSALIGLGERHYPQHLKLFAPIWEHLYDGIKTGNIISVDYVKTELEKKADDWRTDFLQQSGHMFHISDEIESEYASVVSDIEVGVKFNVNAHRARFLSGADPWVIALARNLDECSVVSAETKPLNQYGLAPVCQELGVNHLNLIEFFEENKIGV